MLVDDIVVDDVVHVQGGPDAVTETPQKGEILLMAMVGLVRGERRAGRDIERGLRRRRPSRTYHE